MSANPTDGRKLQEPLTERELSILRLMAQGLSNREVGAKLSLSLGTVKWYNTQIFGKLAVENRTQAVARARALGLLDAPAAPVATSPTMSSTRRTYSIPTALVPFVGREDELADVMHLLADPACRLLTLVGPGGIGKTSMAIETARRLYGEYPEGACFVSLAPLSSPDDIVSTMAQALGFASAQGMSPRQQLLDELADMALLLVLDNFDELMNGATLVSDILRAAPGVKVLATSRERLNLQEEAVYRVSGMRLPEQDEAEDMRDNDAVLLFLQCARRVQHDFKLDPAGLRHITRICRLVEGMPLGIVLAAAWLEVLTPAEIADEIAQSLDFLVSEARDAPLRHRSIRGVFESAWGRLTESQRDMFADLSVFRGSFTREAAQEVSGAGLGDLLTLTNKSLLRHETDGRYHIHELLRQFAAERLAATGASAQVHAAHSRYYLDLLNRWGRETGTGAQSSSAPGDFDADFENIRAAWSETLEQADYTALDYALDGMYQGCLRHNRYQDAAQLFDRAVTLAVQTPGVDRNVVLRLREYHGRLRSLLGEFDGALNDLLFVRDALHEDGQTERERDVLIALGQLYRKTEQSVEAAQYLEQALQVSRMTGDLHAAADTLYHLGTVSWDEGDNLQTLARHREAVDISRSLGLHDIVAVQAPHGLGEALFMQGKPQSAFEYFSESLELARQIGEFSYEAENLQMVGWASLGSLGTGDYDRALDNYRRSLAMSQAAHLDWHTTCTLVGLGLTEGSMGDYASGLGHVQQGLRMAESIGLERFLTLGVDALGQLYQELNLPARAEAAHAQGVRLMLRAESTYWLPRVKANLAIDRLRQGDLTVGADLQDALNLALERQQQMHATRCLEGLAELAVARGEPERALGYADQLRELAQNGGMREMLAQSSRWRGEALTLLNQFDAAEAELFSALRSADEIGRPRMVWDTHAALARLYRTQGRTDLAQQHEAAASEIMSGIARTLPDDGLRAGLFPAAAL